MAKPERNRQSRVARALLLAAALAVTACSPDAVVPSDSAAATASGVPRDESAESALFDSSRVHDIAITVDTAAYEALIQAYVGSESKEWIEAAVTIDGTTYERVGLRLKGNSSLRGLDSTGGRGPSGNLSSDAPESLPWLISLHKFVDGQNHEGTYEFVVRSNGSATSLNEALALELLAQAGLPSQDAASTRLSVNGGEPALRLIVEHPDDAWMAATFDASGALYKAESTGNYSYRGDDPAAYDEVFDQEAGTENVDLAPLIEFLQFVSESDDATFAADIAERLDVDSFATYLAMQDLLVNFDDIDGPGNNSYLYYDPQSNQFTIVPWDYNLAFGGGPGGMGMPGGDGQGGPAPGGGDGQGGPGQPGGGDGPGFGGRSNPLVERYLAVPEYQALVTQKTSELKAALFESGAADAVLADLAAVLQAGATDVVDAATITSEAERISSTF